MDTVASVLDEEVVDFFEREVAGLWVAFGILSNGEEREGGKRGEGKGKKVW